MTLTSDAVIKKNITKNESRELQAITELLAEYADDTDEVLTVHLTTCMLATMVAAKINARLAHAILRHISVQNRAHQGTLQSETTVDSNDHSFKHLYGDTLNRLPKNLVDKLRIDFKESQQEITQKHEELQSIFKKIDQETEKTSKKLGDISAELQPLMFATNQIFYRLFKMNSRHFRWALIHGRWQEIRKILIALAYAFIDIAKIFVSQAPSDAVIVELGKVAKNLASPVMKAIFHPTVGRPVVPVNRAIAKARVNLEKFMRELTAYSLKTLMLCYIFETGETNQLPANIADVRKLAKTARSELITLMQE